MLYCPRESATTYKVAVKDSTGALLGRSAYPTANLRPVSRLADAAGDIGRIVVVLPVLDEMPG